jgi:hypothetical protein
MLFFVHIIALAKGPGGLRHVHELLAQVPRDGQSPAGIRKTHHIRLDHAIGSGEAQSRCPKR